MKNTLLPALLIALFLSCNNHPQENLPSSEMNQPEGNNSSPTDTINGIDVSHFQGVLNWKQIKADGIEFAYTKATQGKDYVDTKFQENWQAIKANGLVRGTYHFFMSDVSGKHQAAHFIKTVGAIEAGDMPPVLDLEQGGMSGTVDTAKFQREVLIWLNEVEKAMGIKPIIYTDNPFADSYLDAPEFAAYILWLAEYTAGQPIMPETWKEKGWAFWQYAEAGTLKGYQENFDHDRFKGNAEDFKKILK